MRPGLRDELCDSGCSDAGKFKEGISLLRNCYVIKFEIVREGEGL